MIRNIYKILFSDSKIVFIFFASLFILIFSIYLGEYPPGNQGYWDIFALILGSIASSVFFPLLIGMYMEHLKEKQDGGFIWSVFEEYFEGGILRVYKDREKSKSGENAITDLIKSFENHKNGTVKLSGVSLRVFFDQTSTFYNNIEQLCEMHKNINNNIKIRALVCEPDSQEVFNRAKIESPDKPYPQIKEDIDTTIQYIMDFNANYDEPIEYGYYESAPYCTLVIFPDKCYFSPNILSKKNLWACL
ncbi:MAG: hypothetical protein NTX42_06990 [Methanothrix sp.]|nr:hypothetical protein [Methanothrix sp.]